MNKSIHRISHVLFYVSIVNAMFSCSPKNSESRQKQVMTISEETPIDTAWAANSVSFALQTTGNKQFVAYYDKNRMMTVASREIGSIDWEKPTLPNKLHCDSHNYVTMDIDKEGYIHHGAYVHC